MKDKLYIPHYQLNKNFVNPQYFSIAFAFFFVSRFLFLPNYPSLLWSIDIPIAILSLIYIVAIKPLLFTGVLPGFYPKEYSTFTMTMLNYYTFYAASAVGRIMPKFIAGNMNLPGSLILSVVIASAIVPFIIFFTLYYSSNYISIKRYTNGTRLVMYSESDKYRSFRLNQETSGKAFLNEYQKHKNEKKAKKQKKVIRKINNDPVLNEIFRTEILKAEAEGSLDDVVRDEANRNPLRRKKRIEDTINKEN